MAEQVQELINKIKREGVQEAEEKARRIEAEARQRADTIVRQARTEAQSIIEKARRENKQKEEAVRAALKQAARDMLLTLRGQMNAVLKVLMTRDVRQALSGQELAGIIEQAVKGYMQQHADVLDVKVLVNEKDLQKLKEGFLARLKERIKKPLEMRAAEDIDAGFIISFNEEKSSFDFSDQSLVEYLGNFLNEEVSKLLKDAVSPKES